MAQTGNDLGMFKALSVDVDKVWSVEDLASKTGAGSVLLHECDGATAYYQRLLTNP